LEREAKAQRDLLESYLAKYREANTRENIETAPADGRIISRASVSNSPAYPKKLPIVLIATLATLLLSAGSIVTGELLRMTAPMAMAALSPSAPARVAKVAVAGDSGRPEPVPQPLHDAPAPDVPNRPTAIERFAEDLQDAAVSARKITVLGTAPSESTTLTALSIARIMSGRAKVVLVGLASSPAIAAISVDPDAPGLAELMSGEASFGQIITRDRRSTVHLVGAGRPGADRSLLRSPRLGLAIDALLRVYEHVVLDAGAASDLPAELLIAQARAVVVPDASMAAEARAVMCKQLKAVGFSEVTMLTEPAMPSEAVDPTPRVVAA
jgi:polysaccharide biosynthesis transport protein